MCSEPLQTGKDSLYAELLQKTKKEGINIMSRKTKKWVSVFLIASMMTSMLIGCGKTEEQQSSSSQQTASTESKAQENSEPATETEVKEIEDKELTILTIPAGAQFPGDLTINSNEFIDMIKEITGYEIDWQLFKTGEDVATQLNLLLASGDAPDLIQITGDLNLVYEYASKGGLAELDEAYEVYGDYLQEIYTEDVVDMLRYEGSLYGLPRYTGGAPIGTWAVRQDWLDELGLDAPTDRDELYDVLVAMKEAYPDCTPLLVNDSFWNMTPVLGSFGIYTNGAQVYQIEDGEVTVPLLGEQGKEFIEYMHKLYKEGLIDSEFITDDAIIEKMIAGQAGVMMVDYVAMCRQMPNFKENNPEGELVYIEPTKGDNGEQGYLSQNLISQIWIVPKSSEDKVDACIDFLNKCNASEEIVNNISLGFEGQSYTVEGDKYVKTENASDYVYKGYYSRVIQSGVFDEWNAIMEGYDGYMEEANNYKVYNDILYAPMGVPSGSVSTIVSDIKSAVMTMIIDGYSDEAFTAMQDKFVENGGEEIQAEYQAWYDAR